MKKYFDTLIKDAEISNTISPEIIHISVKGESLGERSFIGSMVHQFGPVKLSELMMKSSIIYIDDIFDAQLVLQYGLLELRNHAAVVVPSRMEDGIPFRSAVIRPSRRRHVCWVYKSLLSGGIFLQIGKGCAFRQIDKIHRRVRQLGRCEQVFLALSVHPLMPLIQLSVPDVVIILQNTHFCFINANALIRIHCTLL